MVYLGGLCAREKKGGDEAVMRGGLSQPRSSEMRVCRERKVPRFLVREEGGKS